MAQPRNSKKRGVENYTHAGKERVNNPPVGLVTPETDKDAGAKTYSKEGLPGQCYRRFFSMVEPAVSTAAWPC